MQAAGVVFLKPWQTVPGLVILDTSFLIHVALGLRALYRRRHLRIPASEAWQLILGLTIPLLLIPHAANIRIGSSLYGLEFGYPRLIYRFFVVSPDDVLPRQLLLLFVVWLHGCIGLRAWLRSKSWYASVATPLATLATLVPVLAVVGIMSAGLDMRDAAARDPGYAARYGPPAPGSVAAQNVEAVGRITDALLLGYLGLVAGTFALRIARDTYARRFAAVTIGYPGGRAVTVPVGFSVLEASRWAGIAHASACGGRGRCSTCRVRVAAGAETLAPPQPAEGATLTRIAAAADVRLACQIRPTADLKVEPLVAVSGAAARGAVAPDRFTAAAEGGAELPIAAMFVDVRQSTRLAAGRLPYDALFLFDRYLQAVTGPIRRHGGHVTSIAGDGVMSMFGADGGASSAAAHALAAAVDLWGRLEALNDELVPELEAPLQVGIGIHVGVAVVGWLHHADIRSLQFLGDVGNVAAKLEEQTKRLDCTLVVSRDAIESIAPGMAAEAAKDIVIVAGRGAMSVAIFRTRDELQALLASP